MKAPFPMWTPEEERRHFGLVWHFLWFAFGAVFGCLLGGLVWGALQGITGALFGAIVGLFVGAKLGHVFGLLLLWIFRPWIVLVESGRVGPLVCGLLATGVIAFCTLRAFDDVAFGIFISCLGFALGDPLAAGFSSFFVHVSHDHEV